MGKVRPTLVKRISRDLLQKYPDLFTGDFQKNKEILKTLLDVKSKKLRNQIAVYITHLKKIMERPAEERVEEPQE